MAPTSDPGHDTPWPELAPFLIGHGFEILISRTFQGDVQLLVAAHPVHKLLAVANSCAPHGAELVELCTLIGTVRRRPAVAPMDFQQVLDRASVTGPFVRQPTLTTPFQLSNGQLSEFIEALARVGQFVNWGITIPSQYRSPLKITGNLVNSTAGLGCFESWLPTWPAWVQEFLIQAP